MTRARTAAIGRSWLGPAAALVAILSAIWLTGEYLHARYVTPREKALVESLQTRAKTDAGVQEILKPEWDRQHEELVRRRAVYRWGGPALLVSVGVFFAWMRWLRPAEGGWAGLPQPLERVLARETARDAAVRSGGGEPARGQTVATTGKASRVVLTGGHGGPPPQPAGPAALDLSAVDDILSNAGARRDSVLPVLQQIQTRYRYLPDAALRRVAETSDMTPAQLAGVSSFYSQFRLTPTGRHLIRVCEGTACHVAGAVDVRNELRRSLGLTEGCDTDPTGTFTVERVVCIGSCSLAPVITIDDQIYGHLTALLAPDTLNAFLAHVQASRGNGDARGSVPAIRPVLDSRFRGNDGGRRSSGPFTGRLAPIEIRIGVGSCGRASGADAVHEALTAVVADFGGVAQVKAVGCSGLCHQEPLVEVVAGGSHALYGLVQPADVRKLVRQHVRPRGLLNVVREGAKEARARLRDDAAWAPIAERAVDPTPYVGRQVRIVLENSGQVDPLSLEEYRRRDGMRALETCLTTLAPEQVIEQVRASGLRGRGGAGFPTAVKWDLTRRASGSPKYVVCNGDEGDPGAFMDRAVLESDPFRVVEGLIIAGYAIGAAEGIIYVRAEYPVAVRHARAAIVAAQEAGFLGADILGSGFSFSLQVREGAGAFVCGEETALIQSIEGERGMPRLRPPYPAESGLWGRPTLINNVETLACLPWIVRHGPDAFAALGTASSKGTKVFSLTGKVRRSGLIEVPMGITIREIVEDIGGGVPDGRTFKAVLTGGPSGGCIPASLADTRIDYEELAATGAIMGSGGLVVLDDRDCAVEIARYFLEFTQGESCGKCTYCRIGTKRMLEILERICGGRGVEGDLQALEELSARVKTGSLCGLGQTAPNPVLTTLRFFREEYEAHIRERRCPAASCKSLIHFRVQDHCTGCTLCAQACPAGAISARPYARHEVDDDLCTRCGMCVTACPEHAIEVA